MLAHEAIHDALVERMAGAVEVLNVGQASDPEVDLGPVIEQEAQQRVDRYRDEAARDGEVVAVARDVPSGGWFAAPTLATELPERARPCSTTRSSARC